jgi:hypothetical protein
MADAKKFRFVSPGIFLNEIDQSYLPAQPTIVGPVIIGRAEKGPGMIPVKVGTFSEFVSIFGNPIAGNGRAKDVWRDGNYTSPTYGAYAAQAYLRAGVGPVTFVRLMGTQHPGATTDTGEAGWTTTKTYAEALGNAHNGGAFGLYVFASGSAVTTENAGALAAIWYMDSGSCPVLSGTTANTVPREGTGVAIKSDTSGQFKVRILRGDDDTDAHTTAAEEENVTFSLNQDSDNFIRKMFNTNPIKVNSSLTESNRKYYWLGETFERHLRENSLDTAATRYGVIMAVASGSALDGPHEKKMAYRDAMTGWYFAQNTSADFASYEYNNMTKLFKFVGINGHGAWLQNNIKISISNIRAASNDNISYGTFDVEVRQASDNDLAPKLLERFSGCNLDPASLDYVANKIGDTFRNYDDDENRYRTFGDYPNRSKYVRIVMEEDVSMGAADPALLPFGVYGPPRYKSLTFSSGSTTSAQSNRYAKTTGTIPFAKNQGTEGFLVDTGAETVAGFTGYGTASITFPAVGVRSNGQQDGATPSRNAYYGLHTGKTGSSSVFDESYPDYLRSLGEGVQGTWTDTWDLSGYGGFLESQWTFSLDELVGVKDSNYDTGNPSKLIASMTWTSGSMKAGTSWTAENSLSSGAARYQNILDANVNRFTSPLYGGYDGFDIKERDPFRNSGLGTTEIGDYAFYSIKRAINTVADPEVVECNAITMPGLTNSALTKHLIDVCEERADAIGIIDLENGFQPRHESNAVIASRRGNTASVISSMKARNLNNSYGCAYYPWVTIRDSVNSALVKVPPSVVALGTFANTERTADVWFAPAGFQRGGLSQGAAGLVVTGVETKLTSKNRDDLYDININPIASFPREGIVVFGQKTLQAERSALDRINVRRLMLYVKKGISQISSTTLFQPNVQATWTGFKTRADTFLGDVKIRFGVDDFRVILDATTTTPDLVDQNIMYAKIFIKPTRAIEFIAIDFIITKSGASFND